MITDPIPSDKTEYEAEPAIPYGEYRALCDAMQPDVYRKTGVSSEESYKAARNDPRTVYTEINGHRLPLFVPLEHAGGYNVEGSQRLTQREDVYALALPPELVNEELDLDTYLQALGGGSAVIVQTGSKQTQAIKAKFAEKLSIDNAWTMHDFIDPRCPEGHQTASITVYASHFEALDDDGNTIPRSGRPIGELYEEERLEVGESLTELIEASDIRKKEEVFDQLWELHDDRFDWLGKFHPVSMQEDRDFFRQLLSDDRTKSYVRFDINEEGQRVPVCQGIELDDMDQVDWISDEFKEEAMARAKANGESLRFFYGIAGKKTPEKMAKYARDVMSLSSRLFKRGGGRAKYVFESTNMSSLYMLDLVQEYVGQEPNGAKIASEIETSSKLDYWYVESPSNVAM